VTRIAISYRRDDSAAITGRVFDRLVAHYGVGSVFRDIDNIPLGVDFRDHINTVLAGTDITLVVIGKDWLGTRRGRRRIDNPADPVRVEVETALRNGIPVVPVLVDGAAMPTADQLPNSLSELAYRNALEVSSDRDFHQNIARLIRSMDPILAWRAKELEQAARRGEEERQRAEAARQAEEEKQQAEEARQAEEERQRAQAARLAQEEKRRVEAAQQAEEERQRAEAARQAEEEKQRAEAARLAAEERPQARETRLAEETWGRRRGEADGRRADAAGVQQPSPSALPEIDAVEFGAAHPITVVPATPFIVEAWLFRHDQRAAAKQRALEMAGADTRFRSQGSATIARGAQLNIRVKIASCRVEPRVQRVWWTGDISNVAFAVTPDAGLGVANLTGYCTISSAEGLRIGQVVFDLKVGSAPDTRTITAGSRVKSAFASYASADRRQVLARVQGIEKGGIDVFMDVRNLKSGDRYPTKLLDQIASSDVLYLFWSRNASTSEWVDREWRYGMAKRGIDFIDPVPLTDPRRVPPPRELADEKNFNDWTLAYLEYERSASVWHRLRGWIAKE
jgi:hypothetical protein